MGTDISQFNERAQRHIRQDMAKTWGASSGGKIGPAVPVTSGARPLPPIPGYSDQPATAALSFATEEAALNKTERLFLAYLRQTNWQWIGIQSVTLKIGDNCRYTPDFPAIKAGTLTFFEVKGFWRDDARVKIKVAARTFPWARFVAVRRKKGSWVFETIKP